MKFTSTLKNKQLISQSLLDIPQPIEKTQLTSSKTYLKTLTWTKFIVMQQMSTSTSEESSPDSIIKKEKNTFTKGYTTTERSVLPWIYHLLNSQKQSENSKHSDSSNLNH